MIVLDILGESSVGYIREAVQSLVVTLPTLQEYSHSAISLSLLPVCRLLLADFCMLPLPPVRDLLIHLGSLQGS